MYFHRYKSEDEHLNYEFKVDDKHQFVESNSELPWGTQRIKIPYRDLVFFTIVHGNSTNKLIHFPISKILIGVQNQRESILKYFVYF